MYKLFNIIQNNSIGEEMQNEISFTLNNIDYKLIKTDKYKKVVGIITFVRELDIEDFTYYTLLNGIIGSASKKYKTKNEIFNKMFELYDCSIYMSTSYRYKTAYTNFVIRSVNNRLVNDSNLFKECIDLFKEIIFNPLVENEEFDHQLFKEEVRCLENAIKNIYNNKRRYSFEKFLKHCAPNDIISESMLGNLDVLNTIKPKSLYQFYQKILNDSWINIGFLGDLDENEIMLLFDDFKLPSKKNVFKKEPDNIIFKNKIQRICEYQNIYQARIIVGYRFDINQYSKYHVPLMVFNTMFGGMFSSTLNEVIREKHSLTYDIMSSFSMPSKIFYVSCGVEFENVDFTIDLINKEFDKYKNGEISLDVLEKAKQFLINDYKEMYDYPYSALSYDLSNKINECPSEINIIDKIKLVTIDEIKEVSNLIIEDTIFTLLPGDENE